MSELNTLYGETTSLTLILLIFVKLLILLNLESKVSIFSVASPKSIEVILLLLLNPPMSVIVLKPLSVNELSPVTKL